MEHTSFDSSADQSTRPDTVSHDAVAAPAECDPCRACEEANAGLTRRELFARAAGTLGVILVGGTTASAVLSGCGPKGDEPGAGGAGAGGAGAGGERMQGGPGGRRGGPPGGGPGGAPAGIAAKAEGNSFRVPGGGNLKAGTGLAFTYGAKTDPGILFMADGQLKALSARCTHAGCVVKWNTDGTPHLNCPCHGSNFDLTGKVLNGPAKKDLPSFTAKKDGNDAVVTPI